MFLTKLKTAVVAVIAVSVIGAGALVGVRQVFADKPAAAPKGGAAPSAGKEADRPKGDKEKLLGTWKMTAAEVNGRAATEDEIKKGKLIVEKDNLTTVKPDGTKYEATWTIDAEAKPRAIDVVPQDGPPNEKGQTFKGIYELKGDTLKMCMTGPNMERPTEFKTEEGSRNMLLTFKRQPPDGGK